MTTVFKKNNSSSMTSIVYRKILLQSHITDIFGNIGKYGKKQ